jgi:hypothetical protein
MIRYQPVASAFMIYKKFLIAGAPAASFEHSLSFLAFDFYKRNL